MWSVGGEVKFGKGHGQERKQQEATAGHGGHHEREVATALAGFAPRAGQAPWKPA